MREFCLLRNFCSFDDAKITFTAEIAVQILEMCLPEFTGWLRQVGRCKLKAYNDGRSIATLTVEYDDDATAIVHALMWCDRSIAVDYRSVCIRCHEEPWFAVQDTDTYQPLTRHLGLLLFRCEKL